MSVPKKIEVGLKSKKLREEITQERLDRFSQVVGLCAGEFSPTFYTVFRKTEFDLLEDSGLELSKVLHAEQTYEYQDEVRAGEVIEFQTTVTHAFSKKKPDYEMLFIVFDTDFHAGKSGQKLRFVARAKSTIVFREKSLS